MASEAKLGMTREQKEKMVDELTQELYTESNRVFTPMYPWIFVRVLQKEHVSRGGIILPSTDQHKTISEGIVLATWRPFTKETGKVEVTTAAMAMSAKSPVKFTRCIEKRSNMELGDHVLFNHWAGIPVYGFNDVHYRVVREEEWDEAKQGGIIAKVEYTEGDLRSAKVLRDMLYEHWDNMARDDDDDAMSLLAAKLEHRFLLIDKDQKSVTLSGI